MAITYRVHYCPPNPGWNSSKLKQNRWFNNLNELREYLSEYPTTDLWVSYNGKKFVKFNINEIQ